MLDLTTTEVPRASLVRTGEERDAGVDALLRQAVAGLRELAATDPRGFTLALSQVTETTELLLHHARRPRPTAGRSVGVRRG